MESEEAVANVSPRPKSESTVLSVSLPPSLEKQHLTCISCCMLSQYTTNGPRHSFSPELSSLTSDDIVWVMESAAMSRSFLKFLLGPLKHTQSK